MAWRSGGRGLDRQAHALAAVIARHAGHPHVPDPLRLADDVAKSSALLANECQTSAIAASSSSPAGRIAYESGAAAVRGSCSVSIG